MCNCELDQFVIVFIKGHSLIILRHLHLYIFSLLWNNKQVKWKWSQELKQKKNVLKANVNTCFDRTAADYQTVIYLPDFYFPTRPLSTSSYQPAQERPSLLSLSFRRPTHGPPTLPSRTAWWILLTNLKSRFSIWQDLRFWLAWGQRPHRCVFIILSGKKIVFNDSVWGGINHCVCQSLSG